MIRNRSVQFHGGSTSDLSGSSASGKYTVTAVMSEKLASASFDGSSFVIKVNGVQATPDAVTLNSTDPTRVTFDFTNAAKVSNLSTYNNKVTIATNGAASHDEDLASNVSQNTSASPVAVIDYASN